MVWLSFEQRRHYSTELNWLQLGQVAGCDQIRSWSTPSMALILTNPFQNVSHGADADPLQLFQQDCCHPHLAVLGQLPRHGPPAYAGVGVRRSAQI